MSYFFSNEERYIAVIFDNFAKYFEIVEWRHWRSLNIFCVFWFVILANFNPLKRQPHKMDKHAQTIRWVLPTNSLSVFGHFVGLVLKGLNMILLTESLFQPPYEHS